MSIRPSVPEVITVNSEALQTQIRDLLPSQNGFGSELQASNVITPIIDLTSTAEGSGLPDYLQTALAFGSQTAFSVENTTTTILNATGFFRIFGTINQNSASLITINMNDGTSDKAILSFNSIAGDIERTPIDFVVFLPAGHSVNIVSSASGATASGSTRQLATGDGTLIEPSGFPL